MEEFREIHFEGVMLRVYRNGDIWRWTFINGSHKLNNPYWKKTGTTSNTNEYYQIKLNNNKKYQSHRIIAMVYLDLDITDTTRQVDHIDRCRTNNNVSNLQLVSNSQNQFNKNAKGYSWKKDCKKWVVEIKLNGKRVYSKYWINEEDAAEDYIKQKPFYHKID
jgi:hypothetical protein